MNVIIKHNIDDLARLSTKNHIHRAINDANNRYPDTITNNKTENYQ